MIGTVGIHTDAVDDRLTSGNRGAVGKIDVKLSAALARNIKNVAIGQIQESHDERRTVASRPRRPIDLGETVGEIIVFVKISRTVETVRRSDGAQNPAVGH